MPALFANRVLHSKQATAVGLLSVLVLGFLLLMPTISQVYAGTTNNAANKVAAAVGTTNVTCSGQQCPSATTGNLLLLSGSIKTSNTIDLIISVSLQCSLFTTVSVSGNSVSSVTSDAKVWVTIDGNPVPVSDSRIFGGTSDNGQVTFCNRALSLKTAQFTETELITLSENTTTANSFNWMAWNMGSGTHSIQVWAAVLQVVNAGSGSAAAVIGPRTMIAEPTQLANQISF